ncbi:MAG: ATP-binding cassette domain-containing protein [Eggerthella lenta]
MAQAQDSERAAAVLLDRASFRYVDESERGLEAEAGSAAPASGSRVDDVSLSVAPGRCLVLCGRSGDGKSTVLRLVDGLAGTFFPGDLTGVVEVCGADVRRLAPRERTERLGVVMQDPRSQFFMGTVGDEIAFSAENLGVDPAETVRRVHAAAETCGVEGLLGEKLSELSSGQKQRVALAAAIACGPAVLVLDEPTSNLDAQGSEALVRILAELKRRGTAVVVSEHRLHQLLPVADAYVCLRAGRVVERWSADAFARLGLEDAAAYGLRHPDMAAPAPGVGGAMQRAVGGSRADVPLPVHEAGHPRLRCRVACGAVTVIEAPERGGQDHAREGAVRRDAQQAGTRRRRLPAAPRSDGGAATSHQDADYQLYAGSVADEVVLGRRVDEALKARAWEALEAFDLVDLADRHPASLSGGQKQRVTLAAAYCSDADLIVLDEPTSGLDGRGVREVSAWCRTLAAGGKAVAIITHDNLLAALAGDAVVELKG